MHLGRAAAGILGLVLWGAEGQAQQQANGEELLQEGRRQLRHRSYAEAVATLTQAVERGAGAEARYELARAWLRQDRFAEAYNALQIVLRDPGPVVGRQVGAVRELLQRVQPTIGLVALLPLIATLEKQMADFFPSLPIDPLTFVHGVGISLAVGVAAAIVPARGAAKVSIVEGLRRIA